MRKILLTIAACFAAFASAAEMEEGVLVLTDKNFDEELAKHDSLLVEFYAPWCGHCKKLAPEYASAAATLAKQDPPQYIAKVDATENNALAERYEIKGFPTLIFFRGGARQDYTGGRTADTIVSWVNKKTGPATRAVSCADVATETSGKLAAVYWGDIEGPALAKIFTDVAKQSEKFAFLTAPADCAATHGAAAPGVSVFRTFDESPIQFSKDHTFGDLNQWLETASIPKLITFSEDYIEPIFGKGNNALILFSDDSSAAYNAIFKKAAEELNGQILFVQSGTKDGIQQRLAEFVGVASENAPTIRLLQPGEDMKKFQYSGSIDTLSVHAIQTFINEHKEGKLRPHLKSEAEPTEQGDVTVLVGTNFDRIVKDSNKDVLVKFYAPWCGHCKALAPVWEELGTAVSNIENLVIAKFDATANEVEGVAIRGYPTLKFYPKDNKEGVEYDGDRDLESFKEWLGKNSSVYKAALQKHDEL